MNAKVDITSNKVITVTGPWTRRGKRYPTSVRVFSNPVNFSVIMRKHQSTLNRETFYKILDCCSSKVSRSWKSKKDYDTVTDWRRPRRHETLMVT